MAGDRFGEAGSHPAAVKPVAEWDPGQDRAFAATAVWVKSPIAMIPRMCFGLGGYLFSARLPGFIVGHFGSYETMFLMAGSLHPIALLAMSQLSWR